MLYDLTHMHIYEVSLLQMLVDSSQFEHHFLFHLLEHERPMNQSFQLETDY